jgi:hypothetical protein
MRVTLRLVDRIARESRDGGTYTAMVDGAIPSADVNRLLALAFAEFRPN